MSDDDQSLISAYKSIGLFLDSNSPHLFSSGSKSFLLASTTHSYKLYSIPSLKIKLLGPHFPHKIRAFTAINENLYLAIGNIIYKMKYYHIEQKLISENPSKIKKILLIGDILLSVNRDNILTIWDLSKSVIISEKPFNFIINDLLHPMTYLNKVLIIGSNSMLLYNIKVSEKVFDFTETLNKTYKNAEITIARQSPNLHIIALGFSTGLIVLYNIQTDEPLFTFQQTHSVLNLTFSHREIPLLASSDQMGNVNIWDLNSQRLFSCLKFFKTPITCLEFLSTELILMIGSTDENCLKQYIYDDTEEEKFRLIRTRNGLEKSIKKIRFFGEDGLHLIISSNKSQAELRDISILNECMSIDFSQKIDKSIKKRHFDTETQFQLNEILDFDFSIARAKEWGNLLTAHLYSCKPCLWNTEDHTILKKPLDIIENKENSDNLDFITAVAVSQCGNFGLLGFKSGLITKINLQSGVYQLSYKSLTNSAVQALRVNSYNKVLFSVNERGLLSYWDFFSGKLEEEQDLSSSGVISSVEISRHSQLFVLIYESFTIELWDLYKRTRARRFIGHSKTVNEVRFMPNNKYIISSSMDNTVKIWDILSGSLINDIVLNKPIVSFDISEDGEMMASAFIDSREINLWHILIGIKPWGNKNRVNMRFCSKIKDISMNKENVRKIYEKKEIIEKTNTEGENEEKFYQQFILEEKVEKETFEYTELPEGKWLPLVHLDLIKEKNKPKITEKVVMKMPFFLDFDKKPEIVENLKEKVIEEQGIKSRVLKETRDKNMLEMQDENILDRYLIEEEEKMEKNEYLHVFTHFKRLNASQVEFEIRRNLFGDEKKIEKMLGFFERLFEENSEFDLKQVYFRCFLNIVSDDLVTNLTYQPKLESIFKQLKTSWLSFEYKLSSALNLIEINGKILN